ncbi:glycoside hydrolase family 30 beta sandwich domain-containing protein [Spirosoma sp. 48-14]|uniref:glycoside hydrolase family 30 protein n=1 Tax=Spirosoma sp. 48-14 TaxID=1895854 RepID=UPI0009618092|nr:glycoside hydrolase family 30 beta sandwich domain-containing protein [Spirosoma sp. 48-14]OJW71256.1 MAG: glucosylceramidase [Spirosoma sp. 48-14]
MHSHVNTRVIILLLLLSLSSYGQTVSQKSTKAGGVEFWLTDPARSILFKKQPSVSLAGSKKTAATIHVDPAQTYQTIDGFGYTLTGGSAMLIQRMDASARATLLNELFGTTGKSIGTSYLRVSIGASDLDDHVFSYDDLPEGQTDPTLAKFSLAPDRDYLIPVLKQILAINPSIKILGSPWSPPTWMKTNGNSKGGSLKTDYYDAYARYFVKYIQGMAKEGIRIDAITIQNEPLHPGNNPSMLMLPAEQAIFIKKSLGPAFKTAKIKTKIILYDHNADRPDYPITILNDADARKYVDGSAFHLYAGPISALSEVHKAYPDKNLYFTEQWIGAPGNLKGDLVWHVRELIIGGTRNWCRTVLQWNLAADPKQNPHTPGGCTECLGAVTIDGNRVTRNPAYYNVAVAAKFVRPGSVRIASDEVKSLPNVAFKTPDGLTVLIVLNDSSATQQFTVDSGNSQFKSSLSAGAVGTYIW